MNIRDLFAGYVVYTDCAELSATRGSSPAQMCLNTTTGFEPVDGGRLLRNTTPGLTESSEDVLR